MKNIFLKISFLFTLLLFSYSANSQIIIQRGIKNGNLPQNFKSSGQYYYKDVNNYLDNFTGTWEYINGNEKFQIVLTKIVYFHQIDTNLNLNYYEDGIVLRYKKFLNNVLIFESPNYDDPNFSSTDGILLTGYIKDYGRITKTIYMPFDATQVYRQGGHPINPDCRIEKLQNYIGQPQQIKFSLSLTGTINYDHETYAGQTIYSIPNDIIMIKVD